MIIYMINYDNMLRIRHEHTSHDDILNIPPWSKHLPRMPHSPQKLRRFCSEQACKRCERRSRGRFPIFWSQFHEFALSRCLRQKKISLKFLHGFNLSAVVCCVSGSHHQDDQKQDISQARHAALPALPALPLPRLSRCIESMHCSFLCDLLLCCCAYHSPWNKIQKRRHRKINDFSEPFIVVVVLVSILETNQQIRGHALV